MIEKEPRYPCPVCLGVNMSKVTLGDPEEVTLDSCSRCGGIWFDQGEVAALRKLHQQALGEKIELKDASYYMNCHSCHSRILRNEESCPECSWKIIVDCPVCTKPMKPVTYDNYKLDVCQECKGVWFDQIELTAIWNMNLEKMGKKYSQLKEKKGISDDSVYFFLDVFSVAPELGFHAAGAMVEVGGAALEGAGDLLSAAPDVAGSLLEGTGEVAGTVFEVIAEIICGIFEGL